MPKESELEESLRRHMKANGFTVIERTKPQGVDIHAIKNGKDYYLEVEGDTKPDGNPLETRQKYTHLLRAIGQICLRMSDHPTGFFYLVIPEDRYYGDKIEQLQYSLRKLGVRTLVKTIKEPWRI